MSVTNCLPGPDVYEKEYSYWPWGRVLEWVANWTEQNAPRNGVIVDYMCGTGFLLNDILLRRPDLSVSGCSITEAYVRWAAQHYGNIQVVLEDALSYRPPSKADVILCTAGLHHLPYGQQEVFLAKVALELQPNGRFILGEELIRTDNPDSERQHAVLELWFDLVQYAIDAGAPRDILEVAFEVMKADFFEEGEYKRSRSVIESLLKERFRLIEFNKMWPDPSVDYGDGVWVCEAMSSPEGGRT